MTLRKALGNLYRNITHKNAYNKIYPPIYNQAVTISTDIPDVYNKFGEKMEFFYIRDFFTAHVPYGNKSNYFIWDRFNFELKNHFYSHQAMLETMGNPDYRYGMLIEAESITPEDYLLFDKHKNLSNEFDAVFTYSARLLNKLNNAVFMPFNATLWYGTPQQGGELNPDTYLHKCKNISVIASNKLLCEMHHFRKAVAEKCKKYSGGRTSK